MCKVTVEMKSFKSLKTLELKQHIKQYFTYFQSHGTLVFSSVVEHGEYRGGQKSVHSLQLQRETEWKRRDGKKTKVSNQKIHYSDMSIENNKISAFCMSKPKYTNNRGLHVQLKWGNIKRAFSTTKAHTCKYKHMHAHTHTWPAHTLFPSETEA